MPFRTTPLAVKCRINWKWAKVTEITNTIAHPSAGRAAQMACALLRPLLALGSHVLDRPERPTATAPSGARQDHLGAC